jgi:carboxymethylenebutenolidase
MSPTIKESDVTFHHENDALKAFFARPEQPGKYPAIIAIHEVFGLNEAMRNIARRFAREGYVCLAVDLFSAGNKLLCIAQTIGAIINRANDNIGTRRLKSALDFLCEQEFVDKTKLGAIGFCMGGNFAISLSCEDKRIKTIAPFYSSNPSLDRAAELCPVVGSYPAIDFTAAAGRTLDKKLQEANVPHDIKIYDWALHSFMDTCYNAQVAEDAWHRTMEFFSLHINS